VLGEAGLAAHDARPRPRQTEARRRHPVSGRPGARQGSRRHGPHLDRETVPGRVRMRLRTRCLDGAVPYVAHDPHWPASRGAKWSGDMTLFDNWSPRIVALRRKGRTFADTGGACRAVIGCSLRVQGIATAASGRLLGAQAGTGFRAMLRLIIRLARRATTLRSMTRAGPPTAGGGCRLRLQSAPVSERLALDGPRGFGLASSGVLAFLEGT
jgi:hypothetical protein